MIFLLLVFQFTTWSRIALFICTVQYSLNKKIELLMASASATSLDQRGRHGTPGFVSYIYNCSIKSPNDNTCIEKSRLNMVRGLLKLIIRSYLHRLTAWVVQSFIEICGFAVCGLIMKIYEFGTGTKFADSL
jgi:hypothetical protein